MAYICRWLRNDEVVDMMFEGSADAVIDILRASRSYARPNLLLALCCLSISIIFIVLGIFVCTTLFNESHKVFILTKMQQIIIMSVSQV